MNHKTLAESKGESIWKNEEGAKCCAKTLNIASLGHFPVVLHQTRSLHLSIGKEP
jgi:hypothetical protein